MWWNPGVPQAYDPGWFYSSLAQVTAAIVGFLGGFIIVRLVGFMSEWRGTADQIGTTGAAYNAKRNEKAKAQGNPATTPGIEYDEDRLWNELVRLLRRRDRAEFPRVVKWLALGLLALTGVGIVWPLVELQGPRDLRQWAFLVPWAIVVLLAAFAIAVEALRSLKSLKETTLSPDTEEGYRLFMRRFEEP
jgi:preprotein translocase subunit Sss1